MGRKKILTLEEQQALEEKRIKDKLAFELKDLRDEFVPKNPTYFFSPDEEVQYGAHQKVFVRESLDGGTIYLIDIIHPKDEKKSRNNPSYKEGSELRYIAWIDLRKIYKRTSPIFKPKDKERLQYYQSAISSLFVRAYGMGVDMDPEYQRGHVWSLSDKVALIDSIFNNVDIGKFVLVEREFSEAKEKETGMSEILDGKQRYTALLEFYEDRFQYKGYFFSELQMIDRSHFENYSISMAEIRNPSRKQRLETFVTLNTSGRIMDKEHLESVKKMID